jgi:hypothetical protein
MQHISKHVESLKWNIFGCIVLLLSNLFLAHLAASQCCFFHNFYILIFSTETTVCLNHPVSGYPANRLILL